MHAPTGAVEPVSAPTDKSTDENAIFSKALSGRGLPTYVGWVRARETKG